MLKELIGIVTYFLRDKFYFVKKVDRLFILIYIFLSYRMLVYEYVDNGNLDQWLHGDVGEVSPLTWDIRVNVILGTAKGYVDSRSL